MMREDRVVGRVSRSKLKLGLGAMRGRLADDQSTSVGEDIKVCAREEVKRNHEDKKRKIESVKRRRRRRRRGGVVGLMCQGVYGK